jgi:D-xylose transport system substrate-binding protein
MKRWLTLFLAVCLVLAVAGCAPATTTAPTTATTAAAEKMTIGVSFNTLQEERWLRELGFMQEDLKAYPNFELIYQAADSDASKQYAQCENMIAQGIDVLILVSQDAGVGTQIVNYAKKNNVPVLAYDIMTMDCDVDAYASFSLVIAGETMAQYAVDKIPKGNYYILDGDQTHTNAQLCRDGKFNVLQSYIDKGDIKILGSQWGPGWTAESGLKNMENALTNFGEEIDAVICSNDGMATGAAQAIIAAGLGGKILLTGQDGELAACQRIVEGTQAMTVYKPGYELAKIGIDVAVKLALGQDLGTSTVMNNGFKDVPAVMPKVISVDKANMMDTVIKDGWHSYDDVYVNVPASERPPKP